MDQELRWAYAAGLVDGEGCISVLRASYAPKRRPGTYRYCVSVAVAMNDPESVQEVADLWGRPFVRRTSKIRGRGCIYHQSSYVTQVSNIAQVKEFLLRMLPYLRAKRDQALVVLEMCEAIREYFHQHEVPQEHRDKMEQLFLRCRALKTRNASAVTQLPAA